MTDDYQKAPDFDFSDPAKGSEPKEEKKELVEVDGLIRETAIDKLKSKLGGKTKEIKDLKKQIATSGSLTPKMIKEARELARTPKGLDIDKFMLKHKLITFDVEQTLHALLKKDGSFV